MSTLLGYLIPVLLGIGLALLVMSPIIMPTVLRWLADREFFFTLVNEGEWKAVVRAGAFRRGLMAYKGCTEDDKGKIVEQKKGDDGNVEKDTIPERLNMWLEKKLGGIRWLNTAANDEIYRYTFRWVTVRKTKPNEGEEGFVSSTNLPNKQFAVSYEKQLNYIYLRDANYFLLLQDAETAESWMTVTIYAVVTLRILKPYQALFRVDKWLDVTLFAIESALRSWASRNKYETILQKREVMEHQADDEFLGSLTEKGMKLTDYILDRYGTQVKRIQFLEVELPKDFSDKATAQAAAEREAARIATLRDAEYHRFKKITQAVREEGAQGELVFAGETIKAASQGQATTILAPFGPIKSFLEGLIGKKGGG